MSFIIDKQTLDDLGIFSRNRDVSVFGIYNSVHTRGGARILEEMFTNPLDDVEKIRSRSEVIGFFREVGLDFPFKASWFDAAEFYLSDRDVRTRVSGEQDLMYQKVRRFLKTDTEYRQIQGGITALVTILRALRLFLDTLAGNMPPAVMASSAPVLEILGSPGFARVMEGDVKKLTAEVQDTASLDNFFRYTNVAEVESVLDFIYRLDVYMSAAKVASERGFVKAEALPPGENVMDIRGLRHPALSSPVANDMTVGEDCNVIFLTGANMAGKSTFMKAFGIAVFLAHVGFPVPAASMRFSVRDGMYTTINLPDNLNRGYSHFYAEVKRLKKVALSLGTYRNMVVIFDELFRGTNVRDAYDATVAVTEAFSGIRQSIFIISTHIIEAGETLRSRCGNIRFLYLPTRMEGNTPVYTYRLQEGITEDRHGMLIIRNEEILDILN